MTSLFMGLRTRSAGERRDPATGLAPAPLDGISWDRWAQQQSIGTLAERRALDEVHGYEIDTVLAASAEFRRSVGGVPPRWMSRGEALHIARAIAALHDTTEAAA